MPVTIRYSQTHTLPNRQSYSSQLTLPIAAAVDAVSFSSPSGADLTLNRTRSHPSSSSRDLVKNELSCDHSLQVSYLSICSCIKNLEISSLELCASITLDHNYENTNLCGIVIKKDKLDYKLADECMIGVFILRLKEENINTVGRGR
ncbi:hypothetical protein AKJ16_DCAP25539 [Drosera capensis]